ncbi:MAG: gamma carbonic anhydrase family protein [Nitriliruptorales bacterium]|nr:gamma carbonic anhydrase family protein [Nitriliruptorales bacterium]
MSRILTVNGHTPDLADSAFVAETAVLAGRVSLAAGVSVWFGTVIRSERDRIEVGEDTNVQDLTVMHSDPGAPTIIGARVTIGHRAVLHGCTVEDDALIGMGAVVMNGALVGAGAVVAAGAVVTEGTEIPPRTVAAGVPARVLDGVEVPPVPRHNVASYRELADWYRDA